jgi:serine/threonine protein phosphatase 1
MYCIGDIHGRADLLAELHCMIKADAKGFDGLLQVLYLGDYVDRGEASREVIDLLLEQPLDGFERIFLLGNHEQVMLDFLVDSRAMASWLNFGGVSTLQSYGVKTGLIPMLKDVATLRDGLDRQLPDNHRQFLEACAPCYAQGSYYFVHAGIRPGIALDKQELEDQLWIREEFTHSRENHGAIIVHGHSISENVEFLPNRIGIDTGAYYSGVLTALVLEGGEQRLLQTGQGK